METIEFTEDQSIDLTKIENLELFSLTMHQWPNGSNTIYLTEQEVIELAKFLLSYIK